MGEKKEVAGGLSQGEIDQLKNDYGDLILISVKDEDQSEDHYWFKKPDMNTMEAAGSMIERNPVKANTIVIQNCLVKGDKNKAISDVSTYVTLAPHMEKLINQKDSEVKNF